MQLSNPQKPGYCGESKIYVIDWLELFLVSAESMHKNLHHVHILVVHAGLMQDGGVLDGERCGGRWVS